MRWNKEREREREREGKGWAKERKGKRECDKAKKKEWDTKASNVMPKTERLKDREFSLISFTDFT